jgi:hypothetical protein
MCGAKTTKMSAYVPRALLQLVRRRARDRCEYCRLPQFAQEATFHIDHVQPLVDGGVTHADNLALACVTCSLRKGARTSVRLRGSTKLVPLFNPRRDIWAEHFSWTRAWRLIGRTDTGTATIKALGMNRPAVVGIRQMLVVLGEFSA